MKCCKASRSLRLIPHLLENWTVLGPETIRMTYMLTIWSRYSNDSPDNEGSLIKIEYGTNLSFKFIIPQEIINEINRLNSNNKISWI